MKEHFISMFEYDLWASKTLLHKFELQYPINPRIYELVSHLLSAQRIWFDRCMGVPETVQRFQDRLPAALQTDSSLYHQDWKAFLSSLQAADFQRMISYTNFKGEAYTDKLEDILAHVVNHGTHHRGSIIILMKEEGFTIPVLDYIFYRRTLIDQ